MRRDILKEYARLGVKPVSGGSDPADPPDPAPITFTPEQQEFLNKKMGEAREAGRVAAQKKIDEDLAAAKAKKDQEDLAAKGEYEKAIAALTADRDKLKGDHDMTAGELTKWKEAATKELDDGVKELAKRAPKIAALDPGGDDLFARREWFKKALEAAADLEASKGPGGTHRNPKNDDSPDFSVEDIAAQMARARGVNTRFGPQQKADS